MFSKVLVANRGEIAIRAFRAAYELGIRTVAVFPHEDRGSEHRLKADEAYEIGERGHPVRAYLDPEAIVATAVACGADAIYPGYGFLSENPALAEACAEAGITFIGPDSTVLELTGNKARAIAAAKAAGVPDPAVSVDPSTDVDALVAAAEAIPAPLFVKAVAGGGGRGMRRVDDRAQLREAIETCMREAEAAFGDPTVFIEQAVVDPRHIEVQVLADGTGETIHLFERDCSVQRRHQKVVEIAPAPNLDPAIRDRMCADAVRFAREIGYKNAGTVEFLLDPAGQLRLHRDEPAHPGRAHGDRGGHRRRPGAVADADRGGRDAGRPRSRPVRDRAPRLGAAVPDHHRGPRQRLPSRHGQSSRRTAPPAVVASALDGGTVYTGAEVSAALRLDARQAHLSRPRPSRRPRRGPDARWRSSASAASPRTSRSCRRSSRTPTSSPAASPRRSSTTHPQLLQARGSGDRGTKLLAFLADVTVNKPYGAARASVDPASKLPALDPSLPVPDGSRQQLLDRGPGGLRRRAARPAPVSPSPTPPSATPTSRCSRPGCAPSTCSGSPTTSPGSPPSCGRSRPGAVRPTTSRCASSPRTRGSGSPRCARPCPTSACRCCSAGATRSATRRTRPR